MGIFTCKKPLVLFVSLALVFVFVVATSMAQQKTKIAGEMTCAYVMQEKLNVGDTEDHIISLGQSEGTNASTGKEKFMDGAQVVNMSFSDVVKGNGSHQGYIKHVQNGNSTFAGWNGKIVTIFSDEGTPIITFEGIFTYIKGTGQFEDIQGSGTFKGKFISEEEYTVEWEGEYFIKK
jgi:hypothetical protein